MIAVFLLSVLGIALMQSLSDSAALTASNTDCPGGSTSGESSSSSGGPNLHNNDLLSQRRFPNALYRGDVFVYYDGMSDRMVVVRDAPASVTDPLPDEYPGMITLQAPPSRPATRGARAGCPGPTHS